MPPLTSRAQMMRAILLARATVTSIFGLRANICASHDPLGALRRLACCTTALAPMISRRRIVRSPRFETAPSFCLPPVSDGSAISQVSTKHLIDQHVGGLDTDASHLRARHRLPMVLMLATGLPAAAPIRAPSGRARSLG